ncbi:MAG: RidA family protein, partial [Actinobacteria bacterium]|nr:RidA family protein [Actinomycetota bacterium]
FERASALLEGAGLSPSAICKTVDYTTPATLGDYKRTGSIRRQFLGPVYPAAAGILLSRLQHDRALVSLDVIASRHPLEAVDPGWERYNKLTYSPAVKAGDMLFMSGQAALDPATERALFPGDVIAQAEYTYANIIEVLKAAGAGPENLVKTIEYVTPGGLADYRDVARVRDKLLVEPYPASTGAVCEALLRPEFLIEIDPLAVLTV